MLKVRGAAAAALAALLVGSLGACSVATTETGSSGTVAPSVNPSTAGAAERVNQTSLPEDWPAEATVPEGLKITTVTKLASGTSVLGNIDKGDPIKVGEKLRSDWEKNGVLISTSTDEGGTFAMAGISKDGKTQLTATLSAGADGPLQVILTEAPAE